MARSLYYCSTWSDNYKEPGEVWTEAEARAADADRIRGRYTVLIDSLNRPSCALEFVHQTKFIAVYFFDEQLRKYLIYGFSEVSDGRLFLCLAQSSHFDGDSDEIIGGDDYHFSPDGNVEITEFEIGSRITGSKEIDVSRNYCPYPEFGEYDQLIRSCGDSALIIQAQAERRN